MKLGIYHYYDLFYHANSVVCSLKSYFDHFGEPTLSPKTLKLVADFGGGRMIWSTIFAVSD